MTSNQQNTNKEQKPDQTIPPPGFFGAAEDEYIHISPEGLTQILNQYDPKDPQKNVQWTTDINIELPLRIKKTGFGSLPPVTTVEAFESTKNRIPNNPALSVKRNGKWQTITFSQYFDQCKTFGSSLIALGISKRAAINIIGFNSPEWVISFYGSIFGFYLPVGVYTTNGPEACLYVAEHSECEVVVVENRVQFDKYLKVWDRLPKLKYIVFYQDKIPDNLPEQYKSRVMMWADFMKIGQNFKPAPGQENIETRMRQIKPGQCATLVYTSGTTGPPKGVMLSHDNYIYINNAAIESYVRRAPPNFQRRIVSYLPLSHSAAQIADMYGCIVQGAHCYFADASALQGSLIEYLKEARPTFFFSVPRVWEKIEEKMKLIAASNGWLKTKIATWAKRIGPEGTFAEQHGLDKFPFGWSIAKRLVYQNVKKALGLDQALVLLFGSAPLSPDIRSYFLSLNMFLINGYGMTESGGPETLSDPRNYTKFDKECMKSAGSAIVGTDLIIYNPDKNGEGEICYKGRNRFMGYFKMENDTRKTLDQQGYLHSGDLGVLDANKNLLITGRIKELIVTAGGENVAPVLIENQIKAELPFVSNCMAIGDMQKYLTAILTLRHEAEKDGTLKPILAPDVIAYFKSIGSTATTVEQARSCEKVRKAIDAGIKKANEKSISKAQHVQKWTILNGDFSIDGGELTPTMKLKRPITHNKYKAQIDAMYMSSKL